MRQKILPICWRCGDGLERHAGQVAGFLLCCLFLIALGQSSGKFLWYDELFTLATASFPHWRDVWDFYATGLDTGSPLPALIVHVALKLPFGPEISSRLPFTLAFLFMCLCMYSFVRQRYAPGYALGALFFPVILDVFFYSTEARSYALVLAGAGSAMICWQCAVTSRYRPWSILGLWFGLAFAINAHAFAIFLFVPFALAQLLRDLRRGKPDWAVWIAIVLFPAGLLPVLTGERLANRVYGSTFWSRPEFHLMYMSYRSFFIGQGGRGGWILILILMIFAVGAVILPRRNPTPSPEPETCGFSAPEWVLVAGLALLPIYALPVSYLLHVYRPRYVVSFSIGMVILLIGAAAEVALRNRHAGTALLAIVLLTAIVHCSCPLVRGLQALVHPGRVHGQLQASYDDQPWVRLLGKSSLPIVVGDPLLYAPLEYYAQPHLRDRLYYLTDLALVEEYPGSATTQLNFQLFGKRIGYQTMDIANFLPRNPHFLLVNGSGNLGIWLPPYLIGQEEAGNVSLQLLGPGFTSPNIYEVRFTHIPDPKCKE
jgi:hypothetical protein